MHPTQKKWNSIVGCWSVMAQVFLFSLQYLHSNCTTDSCRNNRSFYSGGNNGLCCFMVSVWCLWSSDLNHQMSIANPGTQMNRKLLMKWGNSLIGWHSWLRMGQKWLLFWVKQDLPACTCQLSWWCSFFIWEVWFQKQKLGGSVAFRKGKHSFVGEKNQEWLSATIRYQSCRKRISSSTGWINEIVAMWIELCSKSGKCYITVICSWVVTSELLADEYFELCWGRKKGKSKYQLAKIGIVIFSNSGIFGWSVGARVYFLFAANCRWSEWKMRASDRTAKLCVEFMSSRRQHHRNLF